MTAPLPMWLPLGFQEWMPVAQATTLGLMTFVQEDVPTVTGALLAASGNLPWTAAFLGCFLGIWVGDALLYGAARGIGRPMLLRPWASKFCKPEAVARGERWFAEKGTWALVASRFVPGMRLPTYLAAGFLRLPFGKFLLVTGIAVAIWTTGIFALARAFGPRLLEWLQQWSAGGWTVLLAIIVMIVTLRVIGTSVSRMSGRSFRAACGRALRWEFWPAWLFYFPVLLNYLWLAIRFRGFTLPTAANPGIASGGFVGESKMATLRDLHQTSAEFTAEAFLLETGPTSERLARLTELRRRHQLDLPFILKPDFGQRGVGVKLIRGEAQAEAYLSQVDAPIVVQRYAAGPHEAGVFYYRHPGEARGRIFAITEKVFPVITGDGQHTIEELIWRDPRARFVADKYLQRVNGRHAEILPPGETFKLVEAGNHAQGCIFEDGMRFCTPELEARIDDISQKLEGFFVGRYDIRYASESDLRAGRNFQIIELNGATSEATSIYDARNSLFSAYRTLFRQWEIVFAIGAANRERGTAPTKLAALWRDWRINCARAATYPLAD